MNDGIFENRINGGNLTAEECSDRIRSYIECADGDKTGIMKDDYLQKAVLWTKKLRELLKEDYEFVICEGPDSPEGQNKLCELVKLGLPEAVFLYVCSDLQKTTDVEKYAEYVDIMENASKCGFPDEEMTGNAKMFLGTLCFEFGKYLKYSGRVEKGMRLVKRAVELGNSEAEEYLAVSETSFGDLDFFLGGTVEDTELTDADHDDLDAITDDFYKSGILPFGDN